MTDEELRERIAIVKAGGPHEMLLLAPGEPRPVCSLCGGHAAPIINGRHLSPEKFCERKEKER